MNTRYAVAYINDGDPETTYLGNPICLFGQEKFSVDRVKEYLYAFIPEKKTPYETYDALEKEISKNNGSGQKTKLIFTQGQPTVWIRCCRLCDAPINLATDETFCGYGKCTKCCQGCGHSIKYNPRIWEYGDNGFLVKKK